MYLISNTFLKGIKETPLFANNKLLSLELIIKSWSDFDDTACLYLVDVLKN